MAYTICLIQYMSLQCFNGSQILCSKMPRKLHYFPIESSNFHISLCLDRERTLIKSSAQQNQSKMQAFALLVFSTST